VLMELAIFGVQHCGGTDHYGLVAKALADRG
jgi:hypothetical protein